MCSAIASTLQFGTACSFWTDERNDRSSCNFSVVVINGASLSSIRFEEEEKSHATAALATCKQDVQSPSTQSNSTHMVQVIAKKYLVDGSWWSWVGENNTSVQTLFAAVTLPHTQSSSSAYVYHKQTLWGVFLSWSRKICFALLSQKVETTYLLNSLTAAQSMASGSAICAAKQVSPLSDKTEANCKRHRSIRQTADLEMHDGRETNHGPRGSLLVWGKRVSGKRDRFWTEQLYGLAGDIPSQKAFGILAWHHRGKIRGILWIVLVGAHIDGMGLPRYSACVIHDRGRPQRDKNASSVIIITINESDTGKYM